MRKIYYIGYSTGWIGAVIDLKKGGGAKALSHTYNSSTIEAEAGGLLQVPGQPGPFRELQTMVV